MGIELIWPVEDDVDEALLAGVAEVTRTVSAAGGAVGWLTELPRAESDAWFLDLLARRLRVVVARVDGEVLGLGRWERWDREVFAANGDVRGVMTRPDVAGRGIGRAVTAALVEDARGAGVETLTLDVRGNNHGAIGLYLSLGFREYGRLGDFIAVGPHRFDRVLMALRLATPEGVRSHAGRAEGPGASGG